jgi:PST family polysaccharide transporter
MVRESGFEEGAGAGPGNLNLVQGTRFALASQILRSAIQFGTLALLSRMLLPADFGRYSMVAVMVGLLWTIRDFGLGPTVVQKRSLNDDLLSSLHWTVSGFSVGCWLLLSATANGVGLAFRDPSISPLLQVAALAFPLTALGSVHLALMERRMAFRTLALIEVGSSLVGACAALGAAARGAGAWSLVVQVLVGNGLQTLFLWIASPWRPRLRMDWRDVREVLGFSLPMAGAALLAHLMRNADNFLIGRYLGAEQLGYYNLAYSLLLFPIQNIAGAICRALLPAFAKLQEQRGELRALYLRAAGAIALVVFPLMLGLWSLAEPFLRIIFGDRWIPALPVLVILVPLALVQSLVTTVGTLYQAVGRADLLFRWSLMTSPLVVAAFVAGLPWGIQGVAAAYSLMTLVLVFPAFKIPFGLIGLGMPAFFRMLWRPILFACGMAVGLVLLNSLWPVTGLFGLARLVLIGVLAYGGMVWTFQPEEIHFLLRVLWRQR